MTATILAPLALSEPIKAGRRRYWKQILPVTEIKYNGERIKFDPQFHMDLADAFGKGAYDQVPLVFAGNANDHNMDPRNFGGDIIKMEYRGPGKNQGTWALIEADKKAARVIERNPKLGVSARIQQGLEKADGRFFKRAVNHVLLTMNPKVQGMSPWQAVDLAEDADTDVVDLTAQEYTEGMKMGKDKTRRTSRRQIDLSTLDDDQFQNLLDLAASVGVLERERADEDEDLEDHVDDIEDDEDEDEQPPTPRRRKSKVKTTKVVERESEDDDDDPENDIDADLSESDDEDDEERESFRQLRLDLAEQQWSNTRGEYLREGVPAFMLDLAEPIMKQPGRHTIDLADEDKPADVRVVLTKMLDGIKKIVDLSEEIGSGFDLSEDEAEDSEAKALADAWAKDYSA